MRGKERTHRIHHTVPTNRTESVGHRRRPQYCSTVPNTKGKEKKELPFYRASDPMCGTRVLEYS
ncbi:hypothetical protein C7212DRAFT_314957 [Tuber magnatum]|uniref:Uncharacterized protein n=1 Tax=Tuber magnatum TaxID=42249 RepID=A0A317STC0_9PEZI|nr:hypothetical protein C7212DRAFT_314957 [Tuber magnatum]